MSRLNSAILTVATVAFSACTQALEESATSVKGTPGTAEAGTPGLNSRSLERLRVDGHVRDVLEHPAFAGHAHLLFPWDNRSIDPAMPLTQIGALMPYHGYVEPAVAVAALNRMIDDVSRGQQVFHDFYTPAEKQADPSKHHTGLFFLRGKPGAPFAMIAPGGGFAYVGSLHEGFPHAAEISRLGYNAFVLKYRAGLGGQVATQDLAAAVSYILRNHAALQVSATDYSAWGSSAGARMVASIGSHGLERFGGGHYPKPSTVVMAYTAHADRARVEPPTFVVVGSDDAISPPSAMTERVNALRQMGAEVRYTIYPGLGHGFGLGSGTVAEGWLAEAVRFWERVGMRSR